MCSLFPGVSCNAHHYGAQSSAFLMIATLQLCDDMVIFRLVRVHHLDGFVELRIERRAFRFDRSDSQTRQRVEDLLAAQFHAFAQLLIAPARRQSHSAIEAIEHGQELLQRVADSVLAKVLLLTCRTLAIVVELSLLPREAVEKRVTLGLELLHVSLCDGSRRGSLGRTWLTRWEFVVH